MGMIMTKNWIYLLSTLLLSSTQQVSKVNIFKGRYYSNMGISLDASSRNMEQHGISRAGSGFKEQCWEIALRISPQPNAWLARLCATL